MSIMIYQLGILDAAPSRMYVEAAGGKPLRDILAAAGEKYGVCMGQILSEEGKLHEQLAVLIDGVSCYQLQGLNTKIADGSRILITGIVSGG